MFSPLPTFNLDAQENYDIITLLFITLPFSKTRIAALYPLYPAHINPLAPRQDISKSVGLLS